MRNPMDEERLQRENARYAGTAGRSEGNRALGFVPGFLDCATMRIYLARFADGRLAPCHVLDGLPREVVAKGSLVSGFVRNGFFYTRSAAAKAAAEWVVRPQAV